jgi:3-deoxy-D-manno-octulosonic-acid transferase
VKARLESPKPIRSELFDDTDPRPVFIAGSTWSEDEAVLVDVAAELQDRVRFVLVPHEPTEDHLRELESRLEARGLTFSRYTKADSWTRGVLVVNKTGVLAELYLKSRFAFVGGSFRKTVHSVMEPLAAGALTFLGPLHLNNREALELKKVKAEGGLNCVEVALDAGEMSRRLELGLSADPVTLKSKIKSEIEARTGGSDLVVEWVLNVGG